MTQETPAFLVVGQVARPHGTRGEVFVRSLTDDPELSFVPGTRFRVAVTGRSGTQGQEPEGGLPPLVVEAVRPFKDGWLVLFEGITSRTEAELLPGRDLLRPLEELRPLAEGEVFHHDLPGFRVLLADGTEVGTVEEVYPVEPTDLLEVRHAGGMVLIPFIGTIVTAVDRERRELRIDPPEGLLDL